MRFHLRTALLLAGVFAAPAFAPSLAWAQWPGGRPGGAPPDPAAQNLIQRLNQATAPLAGRDGRQGRFDEQQRGQFEGGRDQFGGRQAQVEEQQRAQQQAAVRAQQEQYNRNLLAQQQAYNRAKLAQQQAAQQHR